MAQIFSIATASSGLSTPFLPVPIDPGFNEPKEMGVNLHGDRIVSPFFGYTFAWKSMTNSEWSNLLAKTGTTSSVNANGFIRIPDYYFSGSTQTWGDYHCKFFVPRKGDQRRAKVRENVILIVSRCIRIGNVV